MRLFGAARSERAAELVVLVALIGSYTILKAPTLHITIGDQNLWYYASYLWAQGFIPYRDFFHSHPPFHILVPTIVILVAGMKIPLLHALPSILGALSGLLVYRMARRELGVVGALLALCLFLFSCVQLSESSHLTGINVSLFFLLLAVDFYQTGRHIPAGLALGMGTASGIYVAVGAVALILVAFLEDRRNALKLATAFAASVGVINGVFLGIAGKDFLDQVYLYHLGKPTESSFFLSKTVMLNYTVKRDLVLFVLTLCAVPVILWALGRGGDRGALTLGRVSLVMLTAYAGFLVLVRRIFTYYFLPPLPFAALASAYLITRILEWRPAAAQPRGRWRATMTSLLVAVVLAGTVAPSLRLYASERGARRYDQAEEIAAYIASTLKEDETIYGEFGIVPLLAILADRRVAGREIESSIMRFESGTSALADTIKAIEADNVAMVVSRPNYGIILYPPFRKYLLRNYAPVRRFRGPTLETTVDVWQKR
jgi:hypothetical protein